MKSVSLIIHSMITFFMFFFVPVIIISCADEPTPSKKTVEVIDYYQFDEHNLDLYGIGA